VSVCVRRSRGWRALCVDLMVVFERRVSVSVCLCVCVWLERRDAMAQEEPTMAPPLPSALRASAAAAPHSLKAAAALSHPLSP
jgi:hypothetical protein